MPKLTRITPCLWFDDQAEEAARFYTSIFADSRIGRISRYTEAGKETHHRPAGSVMVVEFHLEGQPFIGLNGGPVFTFNEAVSLTVNCTDQLEVDHFWTLLSAGGDPKAQQCGWLKDRFGLSWQVVPTILAQLMTDPDRARAARAMQAMMGMKKLDIATLQKAAIG